MSRCAGVAALLLLAECSSSPSAVEAVSIPDVAGSGASPPSQNPQAKKPSQPFDIWYRHELRPGEQMWLLGVDRTNDIAYLRSSIDTPAAFEIVAVHHGEQPVRVMRWVADPKNAGGLVAGDAFQPLDGSFEADLARYGSMVDDMGAWASRPWIWPPHVAASPTHLAYKAAPPGAFYGDWLMLADRDGKNPRRLGRSTRAAYAPVFSNDQDLVAFYACTGSSPCQYALHVADIHGNETRIDAVKDPEAPLFSRGGRHIVTTAHPQDGRGCLMRVESANLANVETLKCFDQTSRARFALDPTGKIALVYGDGEAKASVVDVTTGKTVRDVKQSIGSLPIVSPDGWILSQAGTLELIRTDRDEAHVFPVSSLLTLSDDWHEGRTMATRFSAAGSVELVEIDLAKLLSLRDGTDLDPLLDKALAKASAK